MGLFDKKYCDVCGEKIGFLGNRKLDDGNLCKNCAAKLSPLFSGRRNATVEAIKAQLVYREENEKKLASFRPNRTFGESEKVYIDDAAGAFIVTSRSNWRDGNPDIIALTQVTACDTDINENKDEIYREKEDGTSESYNPPRYEYSYEFNVRILIDSPWFSEIELELSEGNRPDSRNSEQYRKYEREMRELSDALMRRSTQPQTDTGTAAADIVTAPAERQSVSAEWTCPSCQTKNMGGKFCNSCGAVRPVETRMRNRCSGCGWTPAPGQSCPKFCPECGKPLS